MPHVDLPTLWSAVLGDFRSGVRTDRWDSVLEALEPERLEGGELWLRAPHHAQGWVRERLLVALGVSASRVLGRRVAVRLRTVGADRPGRPASRRGAGTRTDDAVASPEPDPARNPRYRFENLVLGEANRLAHAASLAVAEAPGDAYNPLFLCGPPGLGKTHVLHAVGHFVRAHQPDARVRLTTGETFVTEFTAALRTGGIDRFKRRHRQTDLLLVDDVQFLMAKVKTEEEFFHTFNALHDAGAQLVLTCDRAPSELGEMMVRLRERFAAGLVAEIRPPDLPMRLTILRKRAALDDIVPEDDQLLETIARRVTTSARAVEAAFVSVVAFASLSGLPLTRATADQALRGIGPAPEAAPRTPGVRAARPDGPPITVAAVLAATETALGVSADALLGRGSDRRTRWARRLCMYVAREETGASYPALGAAFGRNHTTVLNAARGVARDLPGDDALRLDLDRLRGTLLDGAQPGGGPVARGDDPVR